MVVSTKMSTCQDVFFYGQHRRVVSFWESLLKVNTNVRVLSIVKYRPDEGTRISYQNTNGNVFSKVLPFERNGGPLGTVHELLFKKKQLIPELQQFLVSFG